MAAEPDAAPQTQAPRRQVSSEILRLFVGDAELDPEQRPIAEQASTSSGNRARFEQNRRAAAHVLMRGSVCFLCLLTLLAVTWIVLSVVFYVSGWVTWLYYGEGSCDQPLSSWLLVSLVLPVINSSMNRRIHHESVQVLGWILSFALVVVGIVWLSQTHTCQKTDPKLYYFVKAYVIYLGVTWLMLLTIPIVAVILIIIGMNSGWFELQTAADPETIKKIETIAFDQELFAKDGEVDTNKYPFECCVCTEPFSAEMPIKSTPCRHCFHEECLGKWLKVSTTCPLCRVDLEEAVSAVDEEAGLTEKR